MDDEDDRDLTEHVLAVHLGRSANCSSVGSVVDVLFVSSVVGTALLGAIAVLLRRADGPGEQREERGASAEGGSGDPASQPEEERDEDRPDPR